MQSFLTRAGELLFRWRSFTPIPLLVVAAPLVWAAPPAPWGWLAAGLALCALGQALRAWVLGQVPDGTSGQNEKLIATSLNTAGPYAYTRNPLYLGNFAITVGLCVVAHSWVLVVLCAALFGLQYRAIIAAEESFLRGRFGAAYDAWCAKVPRFWPRPTAATSSAPRPFDARRALRKEHNPFAAWAVLALVIASVQRARAGAWSPLPSLVLLGIVIGAWLGVKAWKHRWFSGNFRADLKRRLRETAR